MEDVVYFELNNWFAVEDYPNAEPFLTWCGNARNLYFDNEQFVKENELCVVRLIVDMSVNWCITAKRSWVEQHCPKLLSDEFTEGEFVQGSISGEMRYTKTKKYKEFLRFPEEDDTHVYGRFGTEFLPWTPENVGIHDDGDLDDSYYDDSREDDEDDEED